MNDALDERGVGGNEYHTNCILNAIKETEAAMLSRMRGEVSTRISSEDIGGPFLISN
jgi:hypothetical protein